MNFLEKYNFNKDIILELEETIPEKLKELIIKQKKLVIQNIVYLQDLGVDNICEIFVKFYDMFLMDNSNFIEVFSKYEKEDLLNKIKQNKNIVEYL